MKQLCFTAIDIYFRSHVHINLFYAHVKVLHQKRLTDVLTKILGSLFNSVRRQDVYIVHLFMSMCGETLFNPTAASTIFN